jgi:hypothetical protein
MTALGKAFVDALVARDWDAMQDVLDPEVDLRALTPGKVWSATGAKAACADVFGVWFPPHEVTERIEGPEFTDVLGRVRADYRLFVRNQKDNVYLVEQRVYLDGEERLERVELICGGFRRVPRDS